MITPGKNPSKFRVNISKRFVPKFLCDTERLMEVCQLQKNLASEMNCGGIGMNNRNNH